MTPDPTGLHAANRRGVLAISGATACFILNDTLVKVVSESLPALQLIFIRGLVATSILAAAVGITGVWRRWRDLLDAPVAARSLFDALSSVTYLLALFQIPLAIATAIHMAAPLMVTLLAVLLLGERVGPRRWLALGAGFTGVLLIVQPAGDAFNAYSLLCLLATLVGAGRDFTTRLIDRATPTLLITLGGSAAVTIVAGAWCVLQPWVPVHGGQLGRLALAGVLLGAGYFLLIVAMRSGEMSVVAPFRYSSLLYALMLGWLVWGDVPNALAWAGSALLVVAGLVMLRPQGK